MWARYQPCSPGIEGARDAIGDHALAEAGGKTAGATESLEIADEM